MAQKTIFEVLGYEVASPKTTTSKFEVVAGSVKKFSAKELKLITQCCLRNVTSNYEGKSVTSLKLHVEATVKGKSYGMWIKLDGVSYKRYKDSVNANIDPSMVRLYDLHDPTEQYGSEEKDYTWTVVRIKEGAATSSGNDDAAFFGDED